jgi:hypothetical protein
MERIMFTIVILLLCLLFLALAAADVLLSGLSSDDLSKMGVGKD